MMVDRSSLIPSSEEVCLVLANNMSRSAHLLYVDSSRHKKPNTTNMIRKMLPVVSQVSSLA